MGITLAQLNEQRDMILRGEELQRQVDEAKYRRRLRDEMALTALTLLPGRPFEQAASESYEIADLMMAERDRERQPKVPETKEEVVAPDTKEDVSPVKSFLDYLLMR